MGFAGLLFKNISIIYLNIKIQYFDHIHPPLLSSQIYPYLHTQRSYGTCPPPSLSLTLHIKYSLIGQLLLGVSLILHSGQ